MTTCKTDRGDPIACHIQSADGAYMTENYAPPLTERRKLRAGLAAALRSGEVLNEVILSLSGVSPFRGELDYHLIRAATVFTFLIFGYQKWFSFEAQQITSFITHSPLVFWLIPAFGVWGASFFLGTTEWLFGTLIFLGFWYRTLGIIGALGSIVTFLGTVTIIPLFPNAWAVEAGGFPAMYLPIAFLMKDLLFLAASFYLLKQDLTRAALELARS
jgi:uncharacterized membrane protein YkgB